MKLLKILFKIIVVPLSIMLLVVGCETWVKAERDGNKWSFEAKASATAELKTK